MKNANLKFTRTDDRHHMSDIEYVVTDAEGTVVAHITGSIDRSTDGVWRCVDYTAEILETTEQATFEVRRLGRVSVIDGITQRGQLAATKSWIREQLS